MNKGVRRRGRELGLKLIYSLQDLEGEVAVLLDDFWGNFRFQDDVLGEPLDDLSESVPVEVRRFAEGLVRGVAEHCADLDAEISRFSTNWSIERMARVDLALLRMGSYELVHCLDVPTNVVINEAIELGKVYGTKETSAFINGILDRISRAHRPQP
ncbi:MAG: transcription antitermination factor NusB [Desulfuromonas sp.]|nr:MAG: transcription antitermination factor NusB [Desulfuromonas sp.]